MQYIGDCAFDVYLILRVSVSPWLVSLAERAGGAPAAKRFDIIDVSTY